MRQLFQQADQDQDGKLSPEEWKNLLNSVGITATRYPCYSGYCQSFLYREEVDHFFSTMDRDFDGRLSFTEIMGEDTSVEKLFKIMDKNGDGYVTKKVRFQCNKNKCLKWPLNKV